MFESLWVEGPRDMNGYGRVREVRVPGFTHLHTASGFSLRYGASHPERLAAAVPRSGAWTPALTDRDSLAGTVRFAKACARAGRRLARSGRSSRSRLPPRGEGVRPNGGSFAPDGRGLRADGLGFRPSGRNSYEEPGSPYEGSGAAPRSVAVPSSTSRLPGDLPRPGRRGRRARPLQSRHGGARGRSRQRPGRQPLLLRPDNHAEGLTVPLGPASESAAHSPRGAPTAPRAARALAGDSRATPCARSRLARPRGHRPWFLRLAARTVGFAAEQRVRPVLSNAVRYADPGLGPVADVLDAARRLVPVDPRRGAGLRPGLAQGRGRHAGRRRTDRRGRGLPP